jgi:hypothetical protein
VIANSCIPALIQEVFTTDLALMSNGNSYEETSVLVLVQRKTGNATRKDRERKLHLNVSEGQVGKRGLKKY